MNLAIIPGPDLPKFSALPAEVRSRTLALAGAVSEFLQTSKGRTSRADQLAARLGLTRASFYRAVKNFREEGWHGLVDGRVVANAASGLPEPFRAWVRQLHLQNQRATTGREVHRIVVERWSKWRRTGSPEFSIPGYDTPPPAGPKGYPEGWSARTILRLKPEAYALAKVRQGSKAASSFLPSILKSRVGSHFGQIVFFDDQDYDVKVVAPGTSQRALRPQGFNCIDYFSGSFLDHCVRLRWWDMEAEKYRTLTQTEFTWFVISYLQKYGYRDDTGTVLIFEHGTATGYANKALSTFGGHSNFDDALAAVTGGKISVNRSGLFNHPAFAGMLFRPQSTGNFKFKAPLEGMFNLVRNRMAALPGAVGRNRDLKPEEQYGIDREAEALLKLYDRLDEEHRQYLTFPLMTAAQFGQVAQAVYQAINSRRDHELEGWEALGHVAAQIRFTPDERSPWLSQHELAKMPAPTQQAALALAEIPGHVRSLRLAPAEVAQIHRKELTRLPDHAIPLLIPTQWARVERVEANREITIKDQLLGPESLHYIARFETADGAHVLKPGTEVLCYLNPFNPGRLPICRMDGSFLGTLIQRPRTGFLDSDGIEAQLHERSALQADLDAAVRPHLEGLMADRAAAHRTNRALASGAPVTPEEKADARSAAADRAVTTRRINRWQDEAAHDPCMDAAAALQPDQSPAAITPHEDIARFLED